MGIYTSLADEMVCPLCGDTNTHVDQVAMATQPKGEDGEILETGIRANGEIVAETGNIPASRHVGAGGCPRIALTGWCESCDGAFAWLFTQHKGVTYVESVDLGDAGMVPPDLESEAERRFWSAYQATRPASLDGMVTQHKVLKYRLDFAVPASKFGIEIDGYEFHSSKESFTSDRRRHRELELAGWRIVRFSGKEAIDSAERCVREAASAAAAFDPEREPSPLGALLPRVAADLAARTVAAAKREQPGGAA